MESLLTPVVGRLLSKFVKSAAGTDGSDLRASLQGGNVSLHNLELNLDAILHELPIAVERAFAMQLTVSIPWTSLTSQPIQITLDTVEVVLSGSAHQNEATDEGQALNDSLDAAANARETKDSDEPFLGGGWMGSLANLLMRTLLNITIKVNNIVVKYKTPTTVATLTCESLHVTTADDLRLENSKDARNWLKKDAELTSLSLSLESLAVTSAPAASQQPLFESAGASVSAQFPVFAVLEKQHEGIYVGTVDIKIESTAVAVTEPRLSLLSAFIAALPKMAGHSEGHQADQGQELSEVQARSLPSTFSPRKAMGRSEMQRRRRAAEAIFRGDGGSATSGVSSAAASAMGAVGAVWSFIVDDAAAESAQMASEGPPVPKISKSNIRVTFSCTLTGGSVLLMHDSVDDAVTPAGPVLSPSLTPRHPIVTAQDIAALSRLPPITPPPVNVQSSAKSAVSPSFLEELEEAAASLPLSPAVSLPTSPEHHRTLQQVGAQIATDATSRRGNHLASRVPSAAAFLWAKFEFLQVGLAIADEELTSLDVQLQSCSVHRTLKEPGPTAVQDVVLGLYPMEGVESSALIDSEGSILALRVCWQPDRDPAASVPHASSIHVGHFFAAFVPGLATTLLQFFGGLLPPQMEDLASSSCTPDTHQAATSAFTNSDGEGLEVLQQDPARRLAPPAWLTGGAVIGCSVLSLQLVALSAASLRAEAAASCVQRASVHLGPFRPTARPGSLTAELFAQQRQPLPGIALRLTVVGARLGVAERWQPAVSRCGGDDALADAGVRCISDAVEVQAMMHEASVPGSMPPDASASAGASQSGQGRPSGADAQLHGGASQDEVRSSSAGSKAWVAAVAVSPVLLRMTGVEVAALKAIADGFVAETSRKFRGPFPQRCPPSNKDGSAAAFATVTLQTSRVQMLYAPSGAGQFLASAFAETDEPHALRLFCASASAALCLEEAAQWAEHRDSVSGGQGATFTAMRLVLRAGPGLSLRVPACEVSIGTSPQQYGGSRQASEGASALSACGPPILTGHDIRLEQPQGAADPVAGPLSLSVQSVSFSLALQQLTLLVSWVVSLLRTPLLPVLPTYPTAQHASGSKQTSFKASIAIISGQVFTVDALPAELGQLYGCARGFTVGLHHFALQLQSSIIWAQADVTGALQNLTQSMHMQMQLAAIDVCTLCSVPDQDVKLFWMLRCQSPGRTQPALAVTSRAKTAGGAVDEQSRHLSIDVHTVEARVTPAMAKEAEALLLAVLCASSAHPAPSKGDNAQEQSSIAEPPLSPMRLAVRSVTLEAASECMANHEQPSMYTTDLPMDASSAVGRAEDVVVLVHSAGQQRLREWPLPHMLSTHLDVSMVSAALTLLGPGLPFRGAPLLLPADIHMSLTRRSNCLSLTMDAAFFLAQVSVPVLLTLRMLADCFTQLQTAQDPQSMQLSENDNDVGHETPICLLDDLRCGLFEPADNLATRPGPLQISCGDEAATSGVWSQPARSWVSCRFPYPRQVQQILVAAPLEGLAGVSVQLSRIDSASGAPVVVPLVLGTWHGSLSAHAAPEGHWLLTAKADAPAAEEWQLSWEGRPSKGHQHSAASMLRSLYVNPVGAGLPHLLHIPPLRLVPFTLILRTKHLRLGICLDDSLLADTASSMLQEDSILADVRDLQVAASRWSTAQAVQLFGSVQVFYLDESTLTQELLLGPFSMGALVEAAIEPQPDSHLHASWQALLEPSLADARLFQVSPIHARPLPENPGICVRIRVEGGPLIVRLSEIAMQQLRLLTVSAAESIERLQRHSQHREPLSLQTGELPSAEALHSPGSTGETGRQPVGKGPASSNCNKRCMLLENRSPIDLCMGQVGTDERVLLPSGVSMRYTWHSAPGLDPNAKRQLRVRSAAAASTSTAQHSAQQETGAGTSSADGQSSQDGGDVAFYWSEAFEGTAKSATMVSIPVQMGVRALLSVRTTQVDGTWHIVLQPSHALVNKTATPIQLRLVGSPMLQASPASDPIELKPGQGEHPSSTQAVMVSYGVSGSSSAPTSAQTSLMVWLGRGNGWSLNLPLAHLRPEILHLQAGGLGADAPETPRSPHAAASSDLFCQVTDIDASGVAYIVFWPPLLLHNGLPCGLQLRLYTEGSLEDVEATVPSGREFPFSVATEGGGKLALCLVAPGGEGAIPLKGWSEPLLFAGSWKEKGSQGSHAALPEAGQFRSVEVGHGQGRLVLLLLAEPVIKGQPVVRLRVMPQAELHNSTELPMVLELPGAPSITLDELSHSMLDWQPTGQRPSRLVLAQSSWAPTELQSEGGEILRSAALDLEHGQQSLVALRSSDAGAAQRVSYISACMQVTEQRGIAPIGGFRGPCESAHISVFPGVAVSNLTPWTLHVMPSTAEAGSRPTAISAGSMQPLLDTWLGADVQQHALLVSLSQSITGCKPPHSISKQQGAAATAATQGPAPSFVDSFASFLEEAAGMEREQRAAPVLPEVPASDTSQRSLSLFQSAGARSRFHLKNELGEEFLLACRVLSKAGRIHFVFFVDPQPPVIVSNNSHADVEIGISLPSVGHKGDVIFKEPYRISHVAAGISQECEIACAPPSLAITATGQSVNGMHQAGTEDAEEEETFIESVTGQRSSRDMTAEHAPLMRVRRAGSDAWDASCVLQPGSSILEGWLMVTVWQQAAIVRVELQDASGTEQHNSSSTSLSRQDQDAATSMQPLRVSVELECLQISVWDDERSRLLGPAPVEKAHSRKQQFTTQPGAREAFCFSVDALSLLLSRAKHSGGGDDSMVKTHALLAARGLQIDSFLHASSHPVICYTETPRRESAGTDASTLPLLLDLQVIQALGGSSRQAEPLQNTWVRSLKLRLPALALALDDALLTFAERAATLIMPKRAGSRAGSTIPAPSAGAAEIISEGGEGHGRERSTEQIWRKEVAFEAQIAAARRLLIEHLDIGPLQLLVDVHVAGTSQRVPYPIDTHRAPVTLSALRGRQLLFRPGLMVQGAMAHYTAGALLSAPGVLGSLELLLNPTGLLHSMSAGMADLLGLPLAALMAGSPAQFLASLGQGPASLLWHVSGWTLTSISGFSTAASHVLKRSMAARPSNRAAIGAADGTAHTFQHLEGEGKGKSSSIVAGVSRGMLGAVGLPLTGALDLVSGVTAGIASSTGVARQATVRRAQQCAAQGDSGVSPALCRRLISAAAQLTEAGRYRLHCRAADATLLEETPGGVLGALAVNQPLLVLTEFALVVLADGGLHVAAVLRLEGATMRLEHRQSQLHMSAPSGFCTALQIGSSGGLSLQLRLQASIPEGWGAVLLKAAQM